MSEPVFCDVSVLHTATLLLNIRVLLFLSYQNEEKFVKLKFLVIVSGKIVVMHNVRKFIFLF